MKLSQPITVLHFCIKSSTVEKMKLSQPIAFFLFVARLPDYRKHDSVVRPGGPSNTESEFEVQTAHFGLPKAKTS